MKPFIMRIEQNELIEQLLKVTEDSLKATTDLKNVSREVLNFKPDHNDWSVLECMEHLNLYGDFYLPEIERCILNSPSLHEGILFKSSLIGDYFVNSIKATNQKKMKAPKMMTPETSQLSAITLDKFIKQLEKLKSLLYQAKKVNLTKNYTAISLTRIIKLRLGDTLRFIVYHNERHIRQAENVKAKACR